ncbi:MAG: hypothetical protein ACKOXK_06435 [Chakrabartia sp.]
MIFRPETGPLHAPSIGFAALILAVMAAGLTNPVAAQAKSTPAAASPTPSPAPPAALAQSPVPEALPVRGQLMNERALAPFLRKLAAARTAPVHIVQLGDSHTAGDLFTGGWRNVWQLRYGAGGRGTMPVGRPTSVYLTMGVTARQTGAWTLNAMLGPNYAPSGAPLGPSGFTQSIARAGASLSLSADSSAFTFDSLSFCAVTGPDAGSVKVTLGQTERSISLMTPEPGFDCFETRAPELQTTATIRTLEDKPVSLTSWTTRRGSSGIILSNLGVVSARLQHWTRLSDPVIAKELTSARPDLIVMAFGTNEGFFPGLSISEEARLLRAQVQRLRQSLGMSVPILLLGPPDVSTARADLALPGLPETRTCADGRYVPGNLARMRTLQIQLATELNLGFWDWQGAMGGPCSASAWTAQGLQRGDYIHFTPGGGLLLGQALAADLDDARLRLGAK